MPKLNTLLQNAKSLLKINLFPENFRCYMCDIEIFEGELCKDCLKTLSFNDGAVCPKCGRKTAKGEICIECKANMPAYEYARSPLVYENGTIRLIGAFKNGRPFIVKYLAPLMAQAVKDMPQADGIVFVPMTESALRNRGYNQADLLATELSKATGIPILNGAVKKVKDTPNQKKLTRAERLKNLQLCFKVDKGLVKGKKLILIDDVLTTGATVESITQVLKKAGTCSVFVLTAASVEYKG